MQLKPQSLHWKCVLTSEEGEENEERISDSGPNSPLSCPRFTPFTLQQSWSPFHFAGSKASAQLLSAATTFPISYLFPNCHSEDSVICVTSSLSPFTLKVKMSQRVQSNQHLKKKKNVCRYTSLLLQLQWENNALFVPVFSWQTA